MPPSLAVTSMIGAEACITPVVAPMLLALIVILPSEVIVGVAPPAGVTAVTVPFVAVKYVFVPLTSPCKLISPMAVMDKGPPEAVADATESDVLLLTQIAPTLVEAANAVNVLAVVICTGLLEDPIAPKILRFTALAEMP